MNSLNTDHSPINSYRRVFPDRERERQFRENGCFVIDLLQPHQVAELIDLYHQFEDPEIGNGFYSTIQNPDQESKEYVSGRLVTVLGNAMQEHMIDYRPLFSNFLVKYPNNKHMVGIHQDWNYLDETMYRSFNVWVSLTPSNPENGGMYILPGSHRVQMPIRSTPFDSYIYDRYRKKIMKHSTGLELQPGQALVYDSGLIHYSSKNRSKAARIACAAVFVPMEAQPKHYFEQAGHLYEYDIDATFFSRVIPGESPGEDFVKVHTADKGYDKDAFLQLFKKGR